MTAMGKKLLKKASNHGNVETFAQALCFSIQVTSLLVIKYFIWKLALIQKHYSIKIDSKHCCDVERYTHWMDYAFSVDWFIN